MRSCSNRSLGIYDGRADSNLTVEIAGGAFFGHGEIVKPLSTMGHRFHDMLFDHVLGDPETLSNRGMWQALELVEQEHMAALRRQFVDRAPQNLNALLGIDDRLLIGLLRRQVLDRFKLDRPFRAQPPVSKCVNREIESRFIEKGPRLKDGLGILQRQDAYVGLLHDIPRLVSAPQFGRQKGQEFAGVPTVQRQDEGGIVFAHNALLQLIRQWDAHRNE
jgi:hypothetical protein